PTARFHVAPKNRSPLMPLRPYLYDRLLRVFGEVKIAFEDEEMVCDVGSSILSGGQPQLQGHNPGEYYRVCCFAPETLVATPQGDRPINTLVGRPTLLTPDAEGLGRWQEAEVRSFGRQPLLGVRLRRGKTTKTVRATPDHRWVLGGLVGPHSFTTT